MKRVEPQVYYIASPQLNEGELQRYLEDIGAPDWDTDAESDGEKMIEVMGRMCYRSFEPGLNENVTKVREGNRNYIQNIISQRHGSVLEHVNMTFIFHNVSRVFTHELVRHRVGTAFSQESMRYVRLDKIRFWLPNLALSMPGVAEAMENAVGAIEKGVQFLNSLIFPNLGGNFNLKKKYTSLIRRVAPIGLATTIGFTANLRTLRHIIEMRTSEHAEEEIRLVFNMVAEICKTEYPAVFADMKGNEADGLNEYKTEFTKV